MKSSFEIFHPLFKTLPSALAKEEELSIAERIQCFAVSAVGEFFATSIQSMLYEQVKDQLTFDMPVANGTFAVNQAGGEPEFDGCAFTIPLTMGLKSEVMDIENAATITFGGTLQAESMMAGSMCMDSVEVVDFGGAISLPSMPDWTLDSLFGGEMPTVKVANDVCVGLLDAGIAAFTDLLKGIAAGDDEEKEGKGGKRTG